MKVILKDGRQLIFAYHSGIVAIGHRPQSKQVHYKSAAMVL